MDIIKENNTLIVGYPTVKLHGKWEYLRYNPKFIHRKIYSIVCHKLGFTGINLNLRREKNYIHFSTGRVLRLFENEFCCLL